jgi:hypothetical protein
MKTSLFVFSILATLTGYASAAQCKTNINYCGYNLIEKGMNGIPIPTLDHSRLLPTLAQLPSYAVRQLTLVRPPRQIPRRNSLRADEIRHASQQSQHVS